jgi:very-short-patch-repair endonuclease
VSQLAAGILDMSTDAVLALRSEPTHGVFTFKDAVGVGLTRHQVQRRVDQGRWVEIHKGVYRIRGAAPTWRGELLAACRAGGSRAVASRRSAAALHELPGGRRDLLEVTCPRWRRARHPRLVVHESTALAPIDVAVVAGIPVTTVARTLFDLGACYRAGMVELAMDRALSRGMVTLGELHATVRRLSRRGRPGGSTLRQLLDARDPSRRPTESVMETKLLQVLRAGGLPEPVPQYEVWQGSACIGRVDLAYPEARIAIEYDSDEFHTGRGATRRDRARRHELIAAGWLPIDVGPGELRRNASAAGAAIAAALRARTCVA